MISFPIGFILTLIVFAVSMGKDSMALYFNLHSAVLVGGGTLTILYFSNPHSVLVNLYHEIKHLLKRDDHFAYIKEDLMALSKDKNHSKTSKDELISYAQGLWSQGTAHELFIVLVSQKKKEIEQRSVDAIQCLKNLAKYPPALGMAGTVMGIVTLFQTLDNGKNNIGASLALALTATFFGLVIANALVMPVADRLQVRHISQKHYIQNVYQILLLINQDESPYLVEEEVGLRAVI